MNFGHECVASGLPHRLCRIGHRREVLLTSWILRGGGLANVAHILCLLGDVAPFEWGDLGNVGLLKGAGQVGHGGRHVHGETGLGVGGGELSGAQGELGVDAGGRELLAEEGEEVVGGGGEDGGKRSLGLRGGEHAGAVLLNGRRDGLEGGAQVVELGEGVEQAAVVLVDLGAGGEADLLDGVLERALGEGDARLQGDIDVVRRALHAVLDVLHPRGGHGGRRGAARRAEQPRGGRAGAGGASLRNGGGDALALPAADGRSARPGMVGAAVLCPSLASAAPAWTRRSNFGTWVLMRQNWNSRVVLGLRRATRLRPDRA